MRYAPGLWRRAGRLLLPVVLLAACAGETAAPPPPTPAPPATETGPTPAPPTPTPPTPAPPAAASDGAPPGRTQPGADALQPHVTDLEDVQTIALSAAGADVYAVLGRDGSLFVIRSTDGGRSFGEPVRATGDTEVLITHYERPAIAADPEGHVVVAWLEQAGGRTNAWFSGSADGGRSFGAPVTVGSTSAHETTMIRVALLDGARPLTTWLQGGALVLARASAAGSAFEAVQQVDAEVCDCCQPQPVVSGGRVLVAYRNVEHEAGGDIRDVFVTASEDDGATFGEPVRASDEHWRLNACPISGPALAAAGDRVYVAWMDGRNDTALTGQRADLWLAASEDGGGSFGPNVRVSPTLEHYHTLPALAAGPGGELHVAWEADEGERDVLYYTRSEDGGLSFATPTAVASSDDGGERGTPRNASLAADAGGNLCLAWTDRLGARIACWRP